VQGSGKPIRTSANLAAAIHAAADVDIDAAVDCSARAISVKICSRHRLRS
jgi:hypothetical protein